MLLEPQDSPVLAQAVNRDNLGEEVAIFQAQVYHLHKHEQIIRSHE